MEKLRVYLIDDEAIILRGLETTYAWERMGVEIVGTSQNPREAMNEILEKKPDIIITDIRMKQMSGLDLICEVNSRSDKKYVWIVISAYRDFEYAQRACELGAFTYLLKPIEDIKLEKAIQDAAKIVLEKKQETKIHEDYERFIENNREAFEDYVSEKFSGEQTDRRRPTRECIEQATEYVQEHLQDEFLNIGIVAQAVYLNQVYFGRLFRRETGKSFKQYLLEERLKRAKILLKETDDTVVEICEKVGIPNPSYFTQQFKHQVGCLPTEYRKRYE